MKAKSIVALTIQAHDVTCPCCDYVTTTWKCKRAKIEGWMNCAKCKHLLYVPELKQEEIKNGPDGSQPHPNQNHYSTNSSANRRSGE